MGVAFGLLRLSPQDFWAMTPLELAAVMKALGLAGDRAPDRDELGRLMRLFPDRPEQTDGR
jgi:uncharacterized phage protein (TIGR02216 family)